MYDRLTGNVAERSLTEVVLEVGGVGYLVTVPLSTSRVLPREGAVTLFVHLHVREDQLRLFGFASASERQLFRMLIGISGVGPAIALAVLSGASPGQVKHAIESADSTYLTSIKGIGRKTAERVIVELREPVKALEVAGAPAASEHDQMCRDAALALQSLGYTRNAARSAVQKALAQLGAAELSTEDLVRTALKFA